MKFKIDENLPVEAADLFRESGYDAMTVVDQNLGGKADSLIVDVCKKENRVVVTLDLDFANLRTYPPKDYKGIVVLRLRQQDKTYVLQILKRTIPLFASEQIESCLWIVEENRIRVREGL